MISITFINPYDYTKPEATFVLEPEAQVFFGIFPQAYEVIEGKPQKKTSYKNLRRTTIAPDSVEAVLLWRRSKRYRTHYTQKISEVPPPYRKREA